MERFCGPRALEDLERLFEFAVSEDEALGAAAVEAIVSAAEVLRLHPYIGRPARGGLRELVISHGRTGYVALYRVRERLGRVEILTLRRQREAGYA